jgi:hypothetical protein
LVIDWNGVNAYPLRHLLRAYQLCFDGIITRERWLALAHQLFDGYQLSQVFASHHLGFFNEPQSLTSCAKRQRHDQLLPCATLSPYAFLGETTAKYHPSHKLFEQMLELRMPFQLQCSAILAAAKQCRSHDRNAISIWLAFSGCPKELLNGIIAKLDSLSERLGKHHLVPDCAPRCPANMDLAELERIHPSLIQCVHDALMTSADTLLDAFLAQPGLLLFNQALKRWQSLADIYLVPPCTALQPHTTWRAFRLGVCHRWCQVAPLAEVVGPIEDRLTMSQDYMCLFLARRGAFTQLLAGYLRTQPLDCLQAHQDLHTLVNNARVHSPEFGTFKWVCLLEESEFDYRALALDIMSTARMPELMHCSRVNQPPPLWSQGTCHFVRFGMYNFAFGAQTADD